MRTTLTLALIATLAAPTLALAKGRCPMPSPPVAAIPSDKPLVQVAVLLDTSNSMDGLIDQARSQLWKIVNEFARAKRGGRPVELQVALYEYGNSRLSPATGWVRQVLPFTGDLDRVSEQLFALTTMGGDEYCGTVLKTALTDLAWSASPEDLKVIFIAGNEPFTQGPVAYAPIVRRAKERGIVVNTIHCGGAQEGAATGWSDGALLADGAYTTIDQGKAVVHFDSPQDAEIARLGVELNGTYVPYGAAGGDGQARQQTQDANATKAAAGAAMERAVSKANMQYRNAGWDLVDAVREGQVHLERLDDAQLPPAMRGMTLAQKRAFLASKADERARLQGRINALNTERERYLAGARRASNAPADTLDAVMAATLREQASCRGIVLQ